MCCADGKCQSLYKGHGDRRAGPELSPRTPDPGPHVRKDESEGGSRAGAGPGAQCI